jgi:hypothetical protein
LCDRNAIIQPHNNSITTIFPRNCIPFSGSRISVTQLRSPAIMSFTKTILIPYSLHAISTKNDSHTASSDPRFSPLPHQDSHRYFSHLLSALCVQAPFVIARPLRAFILGINHPSDN